MQLTPIATEISNYVKQGHKIHVDETVLPVLSPGKKKVASGYLWAFNRNDTRWDVGSAPAVSFVYAPTRAGKVAEDFLAGSGVRVIQTDGYSGYNRLADSKRTTNPIKIARCFAHARRKFKEAHDATKTLFPRRVIEMIDDIYEEDRALYFLSHNERRRLREERIAPLMLDLRDYLKAAEGDATGTVSGAIRYTLNAF